VLLFLLVLFLLAQVRLLAAMQWLRVAHFFSALAILKAAVQAPCM